jgi:hypothetical protein
MQCKFHLLTSQHRQGVKDGKGWSIHTAKGMISVVDADGTLRNDVGELRLPKETPLNLPAGVYDVSIEPYVNREMQIVFAVRKLEASKQQAVAPK